MMKYDMDGRPPIKGVGVGGVANSLPCSQFFCSGSCFLWNSQRECLIWSTGNGLVEQSLYLRQFGKFI